MGALRASPSQAQAPCCLCVQCTDNWGFPQFSLCRGSPPSPRASEMGSHVWVLFGEEQKVTKLAPMAIRGKKTDQPKCPLSSSPSVALPRGPWIVCMTEGSRPGGGAPGAAQRKHTRPGFASLLLTGSSVSFLDASLTVLIQVLLITKVMLVFRRSQHYRIWTPPAPCTSTQLERARAGNQAKEAFWDQEPELQLCGRKQPSPGLSFPIRSKMGTAPPRAIQR